MMADAHSRDRALTRAQNRRIGLMLIGTFIAMFVGSVVYILFYK